MAPIAALGGDIASSDGVPRIAEQEAHMERAEAQLHEERASLHEQGLADHELVEDHERDDLTDRPRRGDKVASTRASRRL